MSAGPPPPPLTPAQFLEFERNASSKSEYIDGQVFALAGTSERHDVIGVNLLSALHRQLRGSSCRVFSSEMRVWIPSSRRFVYPDVSALCGPRLFHDDLHDTLLNPSVVIEILSPSTEA